MNQALDKWRGPFSQRGCLLSLQNHRCLSVVRACMHCTRPRVETRMLRDSHMHYKEECSTCSLCLGMQGTSVRLLTFGKAEMQACDL